MLLNVCKKILNNSKGFSIVQGIILSGVVAAGAVGVLKMSEGHLEELLYLETKQEEAALTKQVEVLMLQESACVNTFGGATFGTSVSNIMGAVPGLVIFSTQGSAKYGGGSIKLEEVTIENDPTNPLIASQKGPAWLVLTLRRLKRRDGPETIVNRIRLTVTTDASNQVARCHTDVSEYILEAKQGICTAMGGTIDTNENCALSCAQVNPAEPLSAACLALNLTPGGAYDTRWLREDGGSVTGDLTFTNTGSLPQSLQAGQITASNFCVGGICRNFAPTSCSTGQIVKGIATDGSVVCTNIACPLPNQYFRGLDSSGNVICNTFPQDSCPAGQYTNRVNTDGSLNCQPVPTGGSAVVSCPSGEYIASIDADGNPTCARDRRVEMQAANPSGCPMEYAISTISGGEIAACTQVEDKNAHGKTCGAGEYLRGFDVDGNVVCESFGGGCAPTTSPPAASTICQGTTANGDDGCGTPWSVEGTRTDGPCSAPICTAQNTFPRGATATSICPTSGYNGMDPCCTGASCSGPVPANASTCEVWELEYDQTWTIGTNSAQNCSEAANVCEFDCDTDYTWDSDSGTCVANTPPSLYDGVFCRDNDLGLRSPAPTVQNRCQGPDGQNMGDFSGVECNTMEHFGEKCQGFMTSSTYYEFECKTSCGTPAPACDISNIEWTHQSSSPPFNNQRCFGGTTSLSVGANTTITSMECETPSTLRNMDNDGSVDLTCVDAGDGTSYLQYDNQHCPCSGGL